MVLSFSNSMGLVDSFGLPRDVKLFCKSIIEFKDVLLDFSKSLIYSSKDELIVSFNFEFVK